MTKEDIISFVNDIEKFIQEVGHIDYSQEKSGIKFPIIENTSVKEKEFRPKEDFDSLCYIATWICLEKKVALPSSIHARMALYPVKNKWIEICLCSKFTEVNS